MDILRRVKAYAEVNELPELKGAINYSPAVLRKKGGVAWGTICRVVHNETLKIVAQLGDYGVTENLLDEQQACHRPVYRAKYGDA